MNTLEIIKSKDGSSTIYNSSLDEHYHSTHGAVQEAEHVFIDAGLKFRLQSQPKRLNVFEMGLGTGLNAILTAIHGNELKTEIDYSSIEAFPLEDIILEKLNYGDYWGSKGVSLFNMIHAIPWQQKSRLYPGFFFQKIQTDFESYDATQAFDLIYWDAFGPRVQPELWDEAIFEKLYAMCADGGVLVTYSAKGSVKRAMISSGFQVEKIPGPPGKREMLRATKI